jgi:sodium-dependent dicarboxylate transporter 2/3/5
MWISKHGRERALLLPIVLSLVREIETAAGPRPRYGAVLVLATAYGASIGGMATKIGTATNVQLVGFLDQRGVEVSFAQFAFLGSGFVALLLPVAILVLARIGRSDAPPPDVLANLRGLSLQIPRQVSRPERAVLVVFVATALVWILAAPIRAQLERATDWRLRTAHVEAAAALLAAIALAVWRPGGTRLLTRASLRDVPWSALLVIGGSFALAAGIEASGLSRSVAPLFTGLANATPLVQALITAGITVLVSAFLSNTATVGVLLPILAAAVPGANQTTVLVTAGLAASCDFALPAGTPPNAIVFATRRVPFRTMLAAGIPLDVIAAVIAALWCSTAVPWMLG